MIVLATKNVSKNLIPFCKSKMMIILLIALPFAVSEQFIFSQAQASQDRIFYGVLGIILAFFELLILQLTLGYSVLTYFSKNSNSSLSKYIGVYFKYLFNEIARVYARVSIGLLLLILPGIYFHIKYSLVSYIVQFDPNYLKGDIDCLEESSSLLKGKLLEYGTILILTHIVILGIQLLGMAFPLGVTPIEWMLSFLFEVLVTISLFLFFYFIYENLRDQKIK